MAAQMHFLIGDYIIVCSRIKHESSSSDEEHAAAKPSNTSHLSLLSNVGYKKTLRLTSEQLVSVLPHCVVSCGSPRVSDYLQVLSSVRFVHTCPG